MTAKVLVVDDVDFNVKLLETKLKQEYYEVFTATNGKLAIEKAKETKPDIILMDIMMPEMDGFEATKHIKSDPELAHIPIIMVTALNAQEDKVHGLEVGADDFLTKPINDNALMTRLKSLVRLKVMMDELRLRDQTNQQFGGSNEDIMQKRNQVSGKDVLIVDDDVVQIGKIKEKLATNGINVDSCASPDEAMQLNSSKDYSLIIVSTLLLEHDGLRLCSQLRSNEETRHTPILIMVDESDEMTLTKGMEMGVNDYLLSPVELNELEARSISQIKRKNYQDELKENIDSSITQSVKDGLTGLYNRRYLDDHLKNMMDQARNEEKPLSLLMLDIDNFKDVNDTYGHPSGDAIIKEIGGRITQNLRTTDMCARYGGEEFVVVLPFTPIESAKFVAERIRATMEASPFKIPVDPGELSKTTSVGLSVMKLEDTPEELIHRADQCLYNAKEGGRNKVVSDAE